MEWVDRSGERSQQILFATSLDKALPPDHPLRLFVEIIGRLDLESLTHGYSPGLGRPGIHPRVMVSVLLWGLLCGVRSSRKLEEALQYRLDFRWLTGGLSIDHSTLSLFRHSRQTELKTLFQQLVLLAQAELARAEAAGEAVPPRIPITDPESRIMPNKEGGFAPNYTPTALVDVQSGIVTDCDVTSEVSDDSLVLPAIQRVQDNFGDKAKPKELLVDQAFPNGYNLTQLEAAGITCYSPTDVTAPRATPGGPIRHNRSAPSNRGNCRR